MAQGLPSMFVLIQQDFPQIISAERSCGKSCRWDLIQQFVARKLSLGSQIDAAGQPVGDAAS